MATINQTIDQLTGSVTAGKQSLDDALFALQAWLDKNADLISEADRDAFSQTLTAEKDTQVRDGEPYGDDQSLVASVLRLHAMRLFYRFDAPKQPDDVDDSAYGKAKYRLQLALRETEMAINEARVDATIANAHQILMDRNANHRWLQDALARLQTVAAKDLVKLADAVPMPDPPPLKIIQRLVFFVLGIKQEEISRRTVQSLKHVAELERTQLIEMITLLADAFAAIDDGPGTQQALALLARLQT